MKPKIYHIYGRKKYDEPLEYVDEVNVEDDSLLNAAVDKQIGESDWVEVVAFPEDSIIKVIPGARINE